MYSRFYPQPLVKVAMEKPHGWKVSKLNISDGLISITDIGTPCELAHASRNVT